MKDGIARPYEDGRVACLQILMNHKRRNRRHRELWLVVGQPERNPRFVDAAAVRTAGSVFAHRHIVECDRYGCGNALRKRL